MDVLAYTHVYYSDMDVWHAWYYMNIVNVVIHNFYDGFSYFMKIWVWE